MWQINGQAVHYVEEFVLSYCDPVIILGGGAVGAQDLEQALDHTQTVIAADGGANVAAASGISPVATIGDMDSIHPEVAKGTPPTRFYHIAEQDSTDFDKALRHVETPCVIAVGFAGGRMDHQMAVLHTMLVRAHQPCLVLAAEDVVFHCPPALDLPVLPGTRVSLFPLAPVTGRSEGLRWPIAGLDFAPGQRSGTSNEATGPVRLEMDAPGMFCFLPRDCLELALKALVGPPQPARWPARAEQYKDPLPS